TADGGLAILGPKGRGKSTLALACVSAGASLAGDDVAVLRPGSAPMLEPGAPFSRLRMDSAEALGRVPHDNAGSSGGKILLHAGSVERSMTAASPLSALYLLEPGEASGELVRRERLTGAAAVLALMSQATSALLLGGGERAPLLRRATEIATTTPVYALHVARDLSRLEGAAERLMDWLREDCGSSRHAVRTGIAG